MSTHKKMLSFEELETQTMLELPDRELMHVRKGHHSHASAASTTTTTTVVSCSQNVSHANNALLQLIPILIPINAPVGSCNTTL
jgi:hypothetical protein